MAGGVCYKPGGRKIPVVDVRVAGLDVCSS
jgi:hypothetical protein